MQLTMYKNGLNLLGRKQAFVAVGSGNPVSYVQGGDPVVFPGYNSYIDYLISGSVTVSGNYVVSFLPSATGPRATWKAVWAYAPGNTVGGTAGAQVAAAANLSAEVLDVAGFASGT
jgi:hypothetical protein